MSTLDTYEGILFLYQSMKKTKTYRKKSAAKEEAVFLRLLNEIEDEKLDGNCLYVSRLKDAYVHLMDTLFSCDPADCVYDLINMLRGMYDFEVSNIIEYMETFDFGSSTTKRRLLLKGDVQSGKTLIMILTAICYLISGKDVVFILRNKLDDRKQLVERFESVFEALRKKNYTHPSFQIVGRRDAAPRHSCIFIDIYSKLNVSALRSKIVSRKAVVYVDEADCRDDRKDTEFINLIARAHTTIFVSATVQDILLSNWRINGADIISLWKKREYRSIEDIKIKKRQLDNEDDLLWTFCDIAIDNQYENYNAHHPKIVLVTVEKTLFGMNDLFDEFSENSFAGCKLPKEMNNICVIEYTGNGIRVKHNQVVTKFKTSMTGCLLHLAQSGGKEKYPNIIIISGDMASRGINFACYDDLDARNNWHITHQVLLKSSASNCSTLLQSCRILGVYRDYIPLKLYTTPEIKEKLKKGYEMCNRLVDECHKKYRYAPTSESCMKIPIQKKDIPDKFTSKKVKFNIICTSNIVKIISEHLIPCERIVYEKVVSYMEDYRNIWIERSQIVKNIVERHCVSQARMKDMCKKEGRQTEVREETEEGLLFTKRNKLWYVRFN